MAINLDHVTEQITVTDDATNASLTVQPKGTGAFNVAAGSSGVNISNGGTVTAITRIGTGGANYTSFPSVTVSPPTTAGGVQATATVTQLGSGSASVQSGGTGYTVGDVITLVGGTIAPSSSASTFTVTAVSGGVITSVTPLNFSTYTALPTNPVSVTGGTGTGATLNVTYYVAFGQPTITNAGSGYVEQPTVTFSGGGGSGAAAFATVGGTTRIRSIGSAAGVSMAFQGPLGFDILQLDGSVASTVAETLLIQPTQFGRTNIVAGGSANSQMWLSANGSGYINLGTNGTSLTTQARITHTASAVNFLNATGGATGNAVIFSSQGSDPNIWINYQTKGAGTHQFLSNNGGNTQFTIAHMASAVNFIQATGGVAGGAPAISAQGSDTNVNLSLTTKGAGIIYIGASNSATTSTIRMAPSGGNAFWVGANNTSVNYLQVLGGPTGNSPQLIARGTDTNVGVRIGALNAGNVDLLASGDPNAGTGALQLRVAPTASAVNYVQVTGAATTASPVVSAQGSDANITMRLASKGTNPVAISTNYAGSGTGNTQVLVTHTPSAVNFFEVTGGSTTNYPLLTAQGSDTNVGMILRMKGAPTGPGFRVENNNGATVCFAVTVSNSSVVNHPRAEPSSTGVATGFTAQGSDTNIDLALTPKGTGNVRFGTYTGTALSIAGYIEIKDAGGTIRRLAVVA
jgi:hypothetical protein